MKRFAFFSFFILGILQFSGVVFALQSPVINSVISPFSGTKQTVTGTASVGSQIVVTGGPFQIAPVEVSSDGTFSIILSLTQNHENIFYIAAQDGDAISQQVKVVIWEDGPAAKAASKLHGKDFVAPEAPQIEPLNQAVDAYNYTVNGTAEAGVLITVSGDTTDTIKVGDAGKFAVTLKLHQQRENVFYFEARDDAGNVSAKTVFKILEQGETLDQDDVRTVIDETAGLTATTAEIADPFTDIEGHPLEAYIETLRKQGVLHGYDDGTFRPNDLLKRAELLKVCTLAFRMNVGLEASSAPFSDTPRLSWFTRFVEVAKEEGIIDGYVDNTFRPEQLVNRAEAMKIILKSAHIPVNENPELEYLYTDIGVAESQEWYYPYVYFMKKNGIMTGYEDGSVRPEASVSRAELATIIVKVQAFMEQ